MTLSRESVIKEKRRDPRTQPWITIRGQRGKDNPVETEKDQAVKWEENQESVITRKLSEKSTARHRSGQLYQMGE